MTPEMVLQSLTSSLPVIAFGGVVGLILSLLINGYEVRVMAGIVPAPEFNEWGQMLRDGVKLTVIWILYALPLLLPVAVVSYVYLLPAIPTLFSVLSGSSAGIAEGMTRSLLMSWALWMLILLPYLLIAGILLFLFGIPGSVRFARTGTIAEAFRFGPILAHIRRIGWISYIGALVILFLVLLTIGLIASLVLGIPGVIGMMVSGSFYPYVQLVSQPVVIVLQNLVQLYLAIVSARYISLLYDSVPLEA